MKLFEPGKIGNLILKNRIVMAPMGMGQILDSHGRLSQRIINHYVTRARGGTGLIITGLNRVSSEIETSMTEKLPLINDYLHVARLNELAEGVHDYGAKIAVQLTAGFGRVAPKMFLKEPPVAPSVLPYFYDPDVMTRELTTEEVENLIKDFEFAAQLVKTAGIDAIAFHAHEGYLWDQFQTELWNKRTDKYGGSFENRLRFTLEVIQAVKKGAGADFPIIYRFGLKHHIQGGRGIEEGIEVVRRMEEAGVDAIEVDAGCYEKWYWAHPTCYQPPGLMVDMAEEAKRVLKIPIIAVGMLGYPELAEDILQKGKADFIALGRALLADPEWPRKTQEGRFEDIRPCIGDNEGCLGRLFDAKYTSCAINPKVGMDREFKIEEAEEKKSVLVVGGGPAGMEAARVAALRGHRVTLWEKESELGGNLIPASIPEFKRDLRNLIRYLSKQIRDLGVTIELGKEVTNELIYHLNPQVVFLATGSTPLIPDIPGIEKEIMTVATDVLLGRKQIGKSVIVIGGGMVGCETAFHLVQKGNRVIVVEVLEDVVPDMFRANRMYLLEQLSKAKVKILTGKTIVEITDRGVLFVGKDGKKDSLTSDNVIIAVGRKPRDELKNGLNKIPEVYLIGDCVKARNIMSAIWEGFRIARMV